MNRILINLVESVSKFLFQHRLNLTTIGLRLAPESLHFGYWEKEFNPELSYLLNYLRLINLTSTNHH